MWAGLLLRVKVIGAPGRWAFSWSNRNRTAPSDKQRRASPPAS